MTRAREILPLTGLRAVAAWWVVLFHFARGDARTPALGLAFASGHVAVDLFFVLSGFVLARRYASSELARLATAEGRRAFWWRRFARVYPLYVVSLAVGFAAEWPGSAHALATGAGAVRLAAQLALLNALNHRWMFRLNWAAWSLSVEAVLYLTFPWTFRWASRASRQAPGRLLAACVLGALVAPAVYTLVDPDHLGRPLALGDEALWSWYLKFFPLQRFPMFIAGIAAARLDPSRLPRFAVPASLLAIAALLGTRSVPYAFLQGGALLPFFVVVVVGLSDVARECALSRLLAWRPVVALGHASYATYILHVPLYLLALRLDPALGASDLHLLSYLALLLVLSLAAHRAVEVPAQRALAAWSLRPHVGPAAPLAPRETEATVR